MITDRSKILPPPAIEVMIHTEYVKRFSHNMVDQVIQVFWPVVESRRSRQDSNS